GEKWVTEMQYSLDEGTTMVDVTDYEYDESGNITSASFTVPYTEERLYVKFKLTGGYSYLKADLWLDFANATLKEAEEPDDTDSALADGEYDIPVVIYKNGSENTHSVNSYVESAELAVSGESTEMTVKLNFTSLDGAGEKWVTEMQYSLDEGTTMVDVTDYEYDESGNITSASFTVPYTEERLYVKFMLTGGYSYLKADLWLDFANATLHIDNDDDNDLDRAALTAALEEAETVIAAEDTYTAESYAVFYAAYEEAVKVNEATDTDTTQTEIDTVTVSLQEAMQSLEMRGDQSAVSLVIEQAEALMADDTADSYTQSSLENLKTVLNAVRETLETDGANMTQEQVDEQQKLLTEAIAALAEKGDLTAIEESITLAESALEETDRYTEESLENLRTVLESVKTALENADDLTQEQVDELEWQLQEAIDSLEAEETESTAKYKLRILIESCYYEEEDYTEETWSVYAEALANAESVYADSSMTDDDYKEAYTALLEAIDQLAEYDEAAEALAEWVALAEELKETIGETNSGYEETSWAAYVAALSMADEDNPYSLTDAQIRSQIAWLEWESEALILLSDLESDTGTSTASVASLIWDTYEENAISVASEDEEAEIALIDDLEDEEEEETTASSAAETETAAGTGTSTETEQSAVQAYTRESVASN
ncbi:MAG: NEAT domain-containing protein, partial [Clostridiales bacterium]|nr:NEAT domain-containing protein [Clostridiales bacterium]